MKFLKMQPTFTLDVPLSPDDAIAKIRSAIEDPELRGHAVSAGQCVEFMIDKSQQRFWSPHLSVQLNADEPGQGTRLFARFSPRPEVWTLFMFFYFLGAFAICAAAVYGYVQWILGATPWALAIIPVGLVTILLLHLASLIGQGLSTDQMTLLRQRFDRAMELAFDRADSS